MLLEATNVTKYSAPFTPSPAPISQSSKARSSGSLARTAPASRLSSIASPAKPTPTTGRILFDGKDVTNALPEVRARAGIGRTFQVPTAFEDMSVINNVMVGAFLRHPHRNDARDQARRIVDSLTGLRADQPARSLGTPGRKRLEIARVLATEPRLLLLDESLAGLTPTELQDAIALVRRIHQMGVTIVIVEHIMEVIMTLTRRFFQPQRVLVFNQGRVISSGTPDEVVRDDAVIEAYLGRAHRKRKEESDEREGCNSAARPRASGDPVGSQDSRESSPGFPLSRE